MAHSAARTHSDTLVLRGYNGGSIASLDDWASHGLPPDRARRHWKDGRSAMELARCWTSAGIPRVPEQLTRLFASHPLTQNVAISSGTVEHATPLPFGPGGPRCHDLALQAHNGGDLVTICIEAKADEPFGGCVANELVEARKRPSTKFPERLDWLSRSLLGIAAFNGADRTSLNPAAAILPYQLLTGIAGTLVEADRQGCGLAIFVVHEFRSHATDDERMRENAKTLDGFINLLWATNEHDRECPPHLCPGHLIGPVRLRNRAGAPHIPLLIGKVRTDVSR